MSEYLMKCLWKGVADVDQQQDAADRIEQLAATNEELEAKLSKSEALLAKAVDMALRLYYGAGVVTEDMHTTLAELKGQDDE